MSVTQWSPARELETFRERFGKMFAEFDAWPKEWRDALAMPIDIKETGDEVLVTASLPGVKPEDVQIDVHDTMLRLRATTTEERDETKDNWHRRERRVGSVDRTVTLPVTVKSEDAQATLKDGILELHLIKAEPAPQTTIKVTAG
jgi:HSP20 family protein